MKMTPFQIRNLEALRAQYKEGLGFRSLLSRSKLFLFGHLLVILGALFYLGQGGPWISVGWALLGFGLGSLLRYLKQLQNTLRFWPVVRDLIAWEKAEQLLREHEAQTLGKGEAR